MRFSLLSLIVFTTLVGGCIAWMVSPSRARRALPSDATSVLERTAGPYGITADVLLELEANVTEEGFRSFATKMNLTPCDQKMVDEIRTLPQTDNSDIVFVGDCSGAKQEWAYYRNGRLKYWDSIGY